MDTKTRRTLLGGLITALGATASVTRFGHTLPGVIPPSGGQPVSPSQSNGPQANLPGFDRFSNAVNVPRAGSIYRIESGGFPDHDGIMVGIRN